jgi:hypothetical protein
MSAQAGESQLHTSLQMLRSRWASTRSVWNDSVGTHFETAYLSVIEQQAQRTQAEMQALTRILAEARRRVR